MTRPAEARFSEVVSRLREEAEDEVAGLKTAATRLQLVESGTGDPAEAVQHTRAELECPVCLEPLTPPRRIWQCSDGHPVCEFCRSVCPLQLM